MKKQTFERLIKEYALLILGTFLTAISFHLFFIPAQIAPGGIAGIATVLFYKLGLPVGAVVLVINIPLFIWAFRTIGKDVVIKSLISTFLFSFILDYLYIRPLTHDKILATLYGGVLLGIGLGIVLRANATTGGTDLAARILHHQYPSVRVPWLMFIIDGVVVILAILFLTPDAGLYALASLFLSSKIIDLLQEGVGSAKAFFVITQKAEEISKRIICEIERGATSLHGRGMYSGQARDVLLCVVSRTEVLQLKKLVMEEDAQAFMMIADVREVTGEGFSHTVQSRKKHVLFTRKKS